MSQHNKSVLITRVAPDITEIRPNFHIRPYLAPAGYEVGFDHLSMHLHHMHKWAGIHCFTNSVIYTSLFHHGHLDHTHISFPLVFHCWLHSYVMWCSLGLQLKNIRLQPRPRPDLQSQIRPRPDLKKSNPVQPYILHVTTSETEI